MNDIKTAAGIEGLTRWHYDVFSKDMHNDACGEFVKVEDIERLLGAHAGAELDKLNHYSIEKDAEDLREIAAILERESYRMNAMTLRKIANRAAIAAQQAAPVAKGEQIPTDETECDAPIIDSGCSQCGMGPCSQQV